MENKAITQLHVGTDHTSACLRIDMAARHGLLTGSFAADLTATLQALAGGFARQNIPVFLPAAAEADLQLAALRGWDIYGQAGIPLRTTVSDLGPDLLARILDLNATQSDILSMIFRIADQHRLLLIDLSDLQAMLQFVSQNLSEFKMTYGNIAPQSVGAIQRAVFRLEDNGETVFFGEPALEISDLLAGNADGRGGINILDSRRLLVRPRLYSALMLWLLGELYDYLPPVAPDGPPQLIFFVPAAEHLFRNTTAYLMENLELVTKGLTSRGVGIFFSTSESGALPDHFLSLPGNRIVHRQKNQTAKELSELRRLADLLPGTPALDTAIDISALAADEVLFSGPDAAGRDRAAVRLSGPAPAADPDPEASPTTARIAAGAGDPLEHKYRQSVNRHSAQEELARKKAAREQAEATAAPSPAPESPPKPAAENSTKSKKNSTRERHRKNFERILTNTLSSAGRTLGSSIIRGIFNSRSK